MTIRLNKVTRDLNVGIATVVDFLQKKGYTIDANPNAKITDEQYAALVKEFSKDKHLKMESEKIIQERQNKDRNKASVSIDDLKSESKTSTSDTIETVVPEDVRPKFKPVGKIDLDSLNKKKKGKTGCCGACYRTDSSGNACAARTCQDRGRSRKGDPS